MCSQSDEVISYRKLLFFLLLIIERNAILRHRNGAFIITHKSIDFNETKNNTKYYVKLSRKHIQFKSVFSHGDKVVFLTFSSIIYWNVSWQKGNPKLISWTNRWCQWIIIYSKTLILQATRITIWPFKCYSVYYSINSKWYRRKLATPHSQPNETNGVSCFCVWFCSPIYQCGVFCVPFMNILS